jgi:hypothetical protein
VAIVIYKDKMTAAICGDLRPNRKIGEGSIRVHEDFYPPGPDPCKERHPKDKYCVCILRSLLISLLVLLSVVPLQAYRVVIIGDSHSDFLSGGEYGTFARHLKKILDDKGYETSLYAWSGSTPSMWLDGTNRSPQLGATVALDRERPEEPSSVPTLAKIFARQKSPVDLIVIELGTNLLDSKRLNTKIVNPHQINALADAVKPEAKVCLWVGAPNYPEKVFNKKQQETLWGAIRDNVTGKDRYVYDSRYQPNLSTNGNPEFLNHAEYCPITVVGKNHRTITDYEHLCTKAATAWAEGVSLFIDCIQKKSSSTPSTHQ